MATREDVYGAIVDYFGDLPVRMIRNSDGWAIYAARIASGLNELRYIFAVVPFETNLAETMQLEQLDWVSFQTRTTTDVHDVPLHHIFPDSAKRRSLEDIITVIDRNKDETSYRTDSLPIKIRLLHDKKKNNYLQYPDRAKLYHAIETYRCVIDML